MLLGMAKILELIMKKTALLSIVILIASLALLSCRTADAAPPAEQEIVKPVVRVETASVQTDAQAHYTSFGFEFDVKVTDFGKIALYYQDYITSEIIKDYIEDFVQCGHNASFDTQGVVVFDFEDVVTENTFNDFVLLLSEGDFSFESYLNAYFDSVQNPVYTMSTGLYDIRFKYISPYLILVEFPEIPTEENAFEIYMAALEAFPEVEGTLIFMSSGTRVLYALPVDILSVPGVVTSEPSETPSVQAPVQTLQSSPVQETTPQQQPAAAQTVTVSEPPEAGVSPGLIILIAVLSVVLITCVVLIIRRKKEKHFER